MDFGGVLAGPGSDMDGLSSVLAGARTRGVRTAILSNDPGGPGAQWLRELGDGRLVDQVVLSGDVGVAKPDPRIYRLTAESLGLDPGDCIFVDDLPSSSTTCRSTCGARWPSGWWVSTTSTARPRRTR